MKKTNIILIILVIILAIALAVMTSLYLNMRKSSKLGLESTLQSQENVFVLNQKIQSLEKELNKYKNSNTVTSVTNITNTNKTNSTEPYIPEGMTVADPNDNSEAKTLDIVYSRKPENVKIEVLKDSVTNTSVEILITDNNEQPYGWGIEFNVQKKVNDKWENLPFVSENLAWNAIAFVVDENNQLNQKLDIEEYYGKLEKGTYRIVKPVYDQEYINLYSDEFEIK